MRYLVGVVVAVAMTGGSATAGDVEFKPIDTKKLVVQPSKTIAAVTAQTIGLVGNTAAGAVEQNGYVKTINNLFGFTRTTAMPTQGGRSALPSPSVFQSTQYRSYNTPQMPVAAPRR